MRNVCRALFTGVLLAALVRVPAAHGQYEDIRDVQSIALRSLFSERTGDASQKAARGSEVFFDAFGKRFDISLEPNDQLINGLSPEQKAALGNVELLRGALHGVDGSWVRLTRSPGRVSGLIWDGAELYGVAPASDVMGRSAVDASPLAPGSTVAYRFSTDAPQLRDMLIGAPTISPFLAPLSITELANHVATTARQIDIGLVADYEFVSAAGATAGARLLEMANSMDAIFVRDLGVRLNVATIELFDSVDDPFTATGPQQLLEQLANHKETTPALRTHGLVHLFTGRAFDGGNSDSRQLVGVANFGSICDVRASVGLTRAAFASSTNALIAAHEIGHNFGAPHDAEPGSPCAQTPATFLMAADVNYSDEFSACSIQQIQSRILGASCLAPMQVADIEVLITPPQTLSMRMGTEWQLSAVVRNAGPIDAYEIDIATTAIGIQIARFILVPATHTKQYTCDEVARRCRIGRLSPGEQVRIDVNFVANAAGAGALGFVAHSLNDSNTANDRVEYTIAVEPAVDVDFVDPSALSSRSRYIKQGETTPLLLDLINRSSLPATDVRVTLDMVGFLPLSVDEAMSAGCEGMHARRWICNVGALGALATTRRVVTLRAPLGQSGGAAMSLSLTSAQLDTDSVDLGTVFYSVVDTLVDLEATLAPPPPIVGSQVRLTGALRNRGPDSASNVEVFISSSQTLPMAVSTPRGPCTALAPNNWVCRLGSLDANESIPLTLDATGEARGHYRVDMRAVTLETDVDDTDNGLRSEFQLLEPGVGPSGASAGAPESSGGGGSIGLFTVVGLLVVGAARAQRRRATSRAPAN